VQKKKGRTESAGLWLIPRPARGRQKRMKEKPLARGWATQLQLYLKKKKTNQDGMEKRGGETVSKSELVGGKGVETLSSRGGKRE